MNANVMELKKAYPAGTKIRLIQMNDPVPVEPGTIGTVSVVDDAGQVHVNWKNGRTLALVDGVDKFEIIEHPFCVQELYVTENEGKRLITSYPLNFYSKKITADNAAAITEFNIIENDTEKDYGYSEIYPNDEGYRAECYKHRLVVSDTYEDAVDDLRENCCNYAEDPVDTVSGAIKQHLDWWMTDEDIPEEKNIPVFSLTNEDITVLLKYGFIGKRIFIRNISAY